METEWFFKTGREMCSSGGGTWRLQSGQIEEQMKGWKREISRKKERKRLLLCVEGVPGGVGWEGLQGGGPFGVRVLPQ